MTEVVTPRGLDTQQFVGSDAAIAFLEARPYYYERPTDLGLADILLAKYSNDGSRITAAAAVQVLDEQNIEKSVFKSVVLDDAVHYGIDTGFAKGKKLAAVVNISAGEEGPPIGQFVDSLAREMLQQGCDMLMIKADSLMVNSLEGFYGSDYETVAAQAGPQQKGAASSMTPIIIDLKNLPETGGYQERLLNVSTAFRQGGIALAGARIEPVRSDTDAPYTNTDTHNAINANTDQLMHGPARGQGDVLSTGREDLPELLQELDSYQTYFYRNVSREYAVAQCVSASAQEIEVYGMGINLAAHKFSDPYTTPETREVIDSIFETMMGIRLASESQELVFKGSRTKGPDTPLSEAFKQLSPVMRYWRENLVPTAAALSMLYNPNLSALPGAQTQEGYREGPKIDEIARMVFVESLDGRAIRSRGDAVKTGFINEFSDQARHPLGSEINIASLACGAAEVVFASAVELIRLRPDLKINIHLADLDAAALNRATQLAMEHQELQGVNIKTHNIDIRSAVELERIKNTTGGIGFDFVDVVGFLEYLPERMAGRFISQAYSVVSEGGLLCAANIRDTHGQLEFTTNCVRWPYIVPRSLPILADIAKQSCGIESENISMVLPDDGAYAVMNIRK